MEWVSSSSMSSCGGYGTFINSVLGSEASHPPQHLPIVYRCMLMCDSAGNIRGLKLGPEAAAGVVVKAVLNEMVSEFCQVTVGDVVSHINGVAVEGCPKRVRSICAASESIVELRLIRRASVDERALLEGGCILDQSPVFLYEVHPRDSLARIANIFSTTQTQIRADNREAFLSGEKQCVLCPGQWLKIRNPDARGSMLEGAEECKTFSPRSSSSSSLSSSGGGASEDESPPVRRVVEVGAGETLEGIAQRHGMTALDLRRHNRRLFPVGEPAVLFEGMRLVVYEKQPQPLHHRPHGSSSSHHQSQAAE